jgi:hypothetical protein
MGDAARLLEVLWDMLIEDMLTREAFDLAVREILLKATS